LAKSLARTLAEANDSQAWASRLSVPAVRGNRGTGCWGRRGFFGVLRRGIEVVVEGAFYGFAIFEEVVVARFFGFGSGDIDGWIGNYLLAHRVLSLNWSHPLSFLTRRRGGSYVRSEKPVTTQTRPDRSPPAHSRHRVLQTADKLAAIMVVLMLD